MNVFPTHVLEVLQLMLLYSTSLHHALAYPNIFLHPITKLFPQVNYGGFGGGGEVLHKDCVMLFTLKCCDVYSLND